ncbi:uncharacterized protein L199_006407 [Kwoniella botswanensis]|uniref:uncharacterized protein n=1 Tax=Kwoniella botswanensis TaxID=1268659 RepID=UPI00315C66FC
MIRIPRPSSSLVPRLKAVQPSSSILRKGYASSSSHTLSSIRLGVYVDAGSRFESQRTSGISHLLDRLAFKSTDKHSDEEMTRLIDSWDLK